MGFEMQTPFQGVLGHSRTRANRSDTLGQKCPISDKGDSIGQNNFTLFVNVKLRWETPLNKTDIPCVWIRSKGTPILTQCCPSLVQCQAIAVWKCNKATSAFESTQSKGSLLFNKSCSVLVLTRKWCWCLKQPFH